jgi:hypothetical protein
MLTAAGHRALLGAMVLLAVGAALIALLGGGDGSARVMAAGAPTTTSTPPAATSAPPEGDGSGPTTTGEPSATTVAPPTTVADDGRIPPGAVGQYTMAPGGTPVRGSGDLVTYSVEVEDAVGYAAEEFARIVDATLSDPRSWIGDGSVAFQRVTTGAQVRIVLGTPATVDQLCLPLDTAGLYSCHQGGTVALNSNRWLQGTESWPGPLDEFRRYAVNHEVGHAIGHGHEFCGGAGQPAPVMMQQSKGLEGCLPNGWPFP